MPLYLVTYWPDWAGGEPRWFERASLKEARSRLVYWMQYDPDMRIVIHKDGVCLSVTALLGSREKPWS